MIKRKVIAVGAAGTLAVAGALTLQTAAVADELDHDLATARADIVGNIDPQFMNAMAEEHDASWSEVYDRLALQSVAGEIEEEHIDHPHFGGVWIDEAENTVFLASTDLDQLADSRATMVEVEYSYDMLTNYVDVLTGTDPASDGGSTDSSDDLSPLGPGVHGGFVALPLNIAVVEADDAQQVEDLADAEGIPDNSFDVEILEEGHETFLSSTPENDTNASDIYGGDRFWTSDGSRCVVGFNVIPSNGDSKGFLTAGHCGNVGTTITEGSAAGGVFVDSIFPGSDWAYVEVPEDVTTHNAVRAGPGNDIIDIAGSDEAPVGSTVCRYTEGSGVHCGTIEARNQSVTYPEGTVNGLIKTSICAEPGDSGSPLMAGSQAQGMLSGGSGNCSVGGTTYAQPINPILNTHNLSLGGR